MNNLIQVQPSKATISKTGNKEKKSDEKMFVSYLKKHSDTKKEATKNKNNNSEEKNINKQENESTEKNENHIELSALIPQLIKILQETPDAVAKLGQKDLKQIISVISNFDETAKLTQEEIEHLNKIVEQLKNTETNSNVVKSIPETKSFEIKNQLSNSIVQEKTIEQSEIAQPINSSTSKMKMQDLKTETQQLIKFLKNSENLSLQDDVELVSDSKVNKDLINYIKQINLVGKKESEQPVNQTKENSQIQNGLMKESQAVESINTIEVVEAESSVEQHLVNNMTSDGKIKENTRSDIRVEIAQTDAAAEKKGTIENTPVVTKENPTVLNKEVADRLQSLVTERIQNPGKSETIKSTVQLTPETLGKVTIELEMIDNKLVGKLVVTSEDAKRLVEQQLKNFGGNTAAQSIKIDKLEVLVTPAQEAFDAAFNFSDQQQSDQKFQQAIKNKKLYLSKNDKEIENETAIDTHIIKGRLNVIA